MIAKPFSQRVRCVEIFSRESFIHNRRGRLALFTIPDFEIASGQQWRSESRKVAGRNVVENLFALGSVLAGKDNLLRPAASFEYRPRGKRCRLNTVLTCDPVLKLKHQLALDLLRFLSGFVRDIEDSDLTCIEPGVHQQQVAQAEQESASHQNQAEGASDLNTHKRLAQPEFARLSRRCAERNDGLRTGGLPRGKQSEEHG